MKTKFARLPRGTIPPTHGFIITYNQHTGETVPLRVGRMARYIFVGLKKMFNHGSYFHHLNIIHSIDDDKINLRK